MEEKFIIATITIKYLGINSTRNVQDLCIETLKTFPRDMKTYSNKGKG